MSEGRSRSLKDMGTAMAEQVIAEGRQAEFTQYTGMTIDLSPAPAVYSPHVRKLKTFLEELHTKLAVTKGTADTDYRATVVWLDGQMPDVIMAMKAVLTDDFLLIVDGKRMPGQRRIDHVS